MKNKKNINNKNLIVIAKGVGTIALLTAISAISVHYLTGNTLSEYAQANPEIAYANHDDPIIPESEPIPETVPQDDSDSEAGAETGAESDINSELSDIPDTDSSPSIDYISGPMIHFYDPETISENRVIFSEGFYYDTLGSDVIDYITGSSYPGTDISPSPEVSYDDLRYLGILYRDFNGLTQAGELICNKAIADDLISIFHELYEADYRIEKVVLVDNYGADDTASITADNTSCFNYRVVEGSSKLSNHAYGLAIDINPFYNPYIVFGGNEDGSDYISPAGSDIYADRSANFPYKIDENDLCYRLFKEHGFTWGGNWNSCKDYQHFQKTK